MILLTKRFEFHAAHCLAWLPSTHACSRMHGHTYGVRLTVTGELQGPWLIDFGVLKGIWQETCGALLDHQMLNDIEGLEEPTAEHLCAWIAERIAPALPLRVQLAEVEVSESPSSSVVLRMREIARQWIYDVPSSGGDRETP